MKFLRFLIICCVCLGILALMRVGDYLWFYWVFSVILISWIVNYPSRRRKRDEALWNKWNGIQEQLKNSPSLFRLCKINSIRQIASTGTKAFVTWYYGEPYGCNAIWVKGLQLYQGDFLFTKRNDSCLGKGEHHEEQVLYINSPNPYNGSIEELLDYLPGNAENCWKRHNKRLNLLNQSINNQRIDIDDHSNDPQWHADRGD